MKKSKPQSKRTTYTPDPQLICEVQRVLRGRIFQAKVPPQLHGLEEQKRYNRTLNILISLAVQRVDNAIHRKVGGLD